MEAEIVDNVWITEEIGNLLSNQNIYIGGPHGVSKVDDTSAECQIKI